MKLEITETEAAIIEEMIVLAFFIYRKTAESKGNCDDRLRTLMNMKIEIGNCIAEKLIIAKCGISDTEKIKREKSILSALDKSMSESTAATQVFHRSDNLCDNVICAGKDCPDFNNCHGELLRGFEDLRGALP